MTGKVGEGGTEIGFREWGVKDKVTERKKNYENVDGNSLNQSLFL